MALLTSTALSDLRAYIKRRVAYAKFLCSGTWHTVTLDSVTITGTVVKIKFMIENVTGTVTKVQLIDSDSQVWYEKTVSLAMNDVAVGFAYVVRVGITETTEG